MISIGELKERFSKDPVPVRLGGIASDLARLAGLVRSNANNPSSIENVLMELKLFTEWVAKDINLSAQETVLSLQRNLADWSLYGFENAQSNDIEKQAQNWSNTILDISGLLRE